MRVAVVEGGAAGLLDYAIWQPGCPDGVGDLHVGRVTARVRALGGRFVALAGHAVDGFLPDTQAPGDLPEGALVVLRIGRAAQGGKGPRLTALDVPDAPADGPVRLLRRGPGAVERFAARFPGARIGIDDAALAAALRPALGERIDRVARSFDAELDAAVSALESRRAELPGGGALRIEPTAALTAIDVDVGSAAGLPGAAGSGSKTAAHAGFNRAMLPHLARQIRLRNLSGAILVDVAGLSVRRRQALGAALQDVLRQDPVETRLVGFTGLGLAEILRRRIHPPLHEMLATPHAAMAAALRAAIAVVQPGTALTLHAAPALLHAFEHDGTMRVELAGSVAHALMLRSEPALAPAGFRLELGRGR